MKKITMFVEDISDDYQLIPFYPVIENQNKLKDQLHNTGIDGFKNGVKRTIQFIKDKYPQAYNQIDADIDDDDDEDDDDIPMQSQYTESPVNFNIDAKEITVVPNGILINDRLLPTRLLMGAANAVENLQQELKDN